LTDNHKLLLYDKKVMYSNLSGLITALLTPFDKFGEVKEDSLRSLVEFQVDGGVDGLFLCGTAGSGVLMRPDQRVKVFKTVVDQSVDRVKILAHVGSTSTEEAVNLAKEAEDVGVNAIVAVPPFYMKPDEESILNYFKAIAMMVNLPLYIYNIPGNALNAVTPDMMVKLSEVKNIVGVKDSSRNFINLLEYIRVLPENFTVICGSDSYIYPAILMGAKGCITGYANPFPEIYSRFMKTIAEGNHEEAKKQQFYITELRKVFQKPPLAPHYEALRMRGIDAGYPRPPLRSLKPEEKETLRNRLLKLGALK
jgi:4-hydroxy-tetrahydrodipicolinate synthase